MTTSQDRQYYVYIMTNSVRTLYLGVTNDIAPNLLFRSPCHSDRPLCHSDHPHCHSE